jgi:hypothetical protein
VVKGHSGDEEDFLCFVCGALKRGSHGFALVWMTRRYGVICFAECSRRDSHMYLLALRSALQETRVYVCLLVWVLVSLSIERRVCGFFQDVVDENGNGVF